MKKYFTILTVIASVLACTPNLAPEFVPESGNGSQSTEETPVPVQSVELNTAALTLEIGETATLTVTIVPSNASNKSLVWSSSKDAVATVSQKGEVVALAEGECVVTVSCDGKKAECAVTVAKHFVSVSSISLNSTSESLLVGETFQLIATVLPEDATDKTVTWSTSNEGVAMVDNGLIVAVSAGEATITASAGECSATCLVTVSMPFSYDGMCLESVSNGYIIISNPNQLTIECKVENNDWLSSSDTSIRIETKAGDKVWFRGNNETYTTGNMSDGLVATTFLCYNSDYYLYGNLMSLLYGDEFKSSSSIIGEFAFFKLFSQNEKIINHPSKDIELPATTLSASCYRNMFYSCVNLTRAPKLPAKVLTEACYASMFAYCSSLKEFPKMSASEMAYMSCTWMMMGSGIEKAPELPAMNLARACYEFMFSECPNLTGCPSVLPATELYANCYTGMFQRCEKLEDAPVLPSTDLKYSCYSHMFNGCKSLKKAPKLPATSLAEACYQRMFGNSGLTEAPELPAMDLEVMCYQYMFEGCSSLVKAPVLPATTLNYWCYEKMFSGCSSLNYIKMMGTKVKKDTWSGYKLVDLTNDNIGSYCTEWVNGVAANGTFVKNQEAVWDATGANGIPEGWTVE